jgi:hypothetical protein
VVTCMCSLSFPPCRTWYLKPSYTPFISFNILAEILYFSNISQITHRFTESKTFQKSINVKYNMFCHSLLCSTMSRHSCVVPESLLVPFEVSVPLHFIFYSE